MTEILIKAMKKYWDSVFIALCSFTLRQLYLRERVSCTHKGEVWLDAKASLNPTAKINSTCPGRGPDSCSPASWKRVLLCCIHTHTHVHKVQCVYKWMVQFQKLPRNLFLTLHEHNVHRQQRQLSRFLMRYQQFAFHAYCGAAGSVYKMAPRPRNKHERANCW